MHSFFANMIHRLQTKQQSNPARESRHRRHSRASRQTKEETLTASINTVNESVRASLGLHYSHQTEAHSCLYSSYARDSRALLF